MKDLLLSKGIILQSGEISKDKINLVAGAITQPFAEMVWVTTDGDMETVNRLTDILVFMNNPADRASCSKSLSCFTGLWVCASPRKPSRWTQTPTFWNISSFPLRQTLAKSCRILSLMKKNNDPHRRRFSLLTEEKRNSAIFMLSCYAVEPKKALYHATLRARF